MNFRTPNLECGDSSPLFSYFFDLRLSSFVLTALVSMDGWGPRRAAGARAGVAAAAEASVLAAGCKCTRDRAELCCDRARSRPPGCWARGPARERQSTTVDAACRPAKCEYTPRFPIRPSAPANRVGVSWKALSQCGVLAPRVRSQAAPWERQIKNALAWAASPSWKPRAKFATGDPLAQRAVGADANGCIGANRPVIPVDTTAFLVAFPSSAPRGAADALRWGVCVSRLLHFAPS